MNDTDTASILYPRDFLSYFNFMFSEYAGILLQLKVRVSIKKPLVRKVTSRRPSHEDQVR